MEVVDQGVPAESPTAPQTDPTTAQAPSQPVNGNGQQARTIPLDAHIRERQNWQRREQEYQQRLRQYEQRPAQPQAPQQPLSVEDRIQQEQAMEALERLIAQHPKLKGLIELAGNAPQLQQLESRMGELVQAHFVTTGNGMVERFAQQHGLKADDVYDAFGLLVADDPQLFERVKGGDVALVARMLKSVEPIVKSLKAQGASAQRQATATLGANKIATSQLPPRGTSSALPGEPAPKPLEPGKEREYRREMHNDARRAIREAMSQG